MATLFFDIETKSLTKQDADDALSPATARVATLSVYDLERATGTIYIEGSTDVTLSLGSWRVKVVSEVALLQDFWQGIQDYDVYVGFATRRFDVPFLLHRSIAHDVATSQRLCNNRFLIKQELPFHVDLADEFSCNGTMSRALSLRSLVDLYGITHEFLAYEAVQALISEAAYEPIAEHARHKLLATVALYKKWQQHLAPPHFLNTIEL